MLVCAKYWGRLDAHSLFEPKYSFDSRMRWCIRCNHAIMHSISVLDIDVAGPGSIPNVRRARTVAIIDPRSYIQRPNGTSWLAARPTRLAVVSTAFDPIQQ
jgi:hypothetical protein